MEVIIEQSTPSKDAATSDTLLENPTPVIVTKVPPAEVPIFGLILVTNGVKFFLYDTKVEEFWLIPKIDIKSGQSV